MSKTQLITGNEKKRRFSDVERRQFVQEAMCPGSSVAEVSRKYNISQSILHLWKKKYTASRFTQVQVDSSEESELRFAHNPDFIKPRASNETIRIHLSAGVIVEFPLSVSPSSIALFLKSLRSQK